MVSPRRRCLAPDTSHQIVPILFLRRSPCYKILEGKIRVLFYPSLQTLLWLKGLKYLQALKKKKKKILLDRHW